MYHSAPSNTVTFEVQPNLMDYITVEESGGVLTVRANTSITWQGTSNTPVLTVSTPSLTRVTHTGAGSFHTIDPIAGESLDLNIAGAATVHAELAVNNLSISIAGAGNLHLFGTADTVDISMAGAGRVEALDLQTRVTSINLAGAGTVKISCSDELKVAAGGVGTVEYRGSPTVDVSRGGLVNVRQVS